MTKVYINEARVFPEMENQPIKITFENPFFEDSGSYTLELTFPLSIEDNVKVFGKLNRLDVTKTPADFNALIISENRTVFKGVAKITKVTEKSVGLQLLSGNSKVWFGSRYEKLFIDEIFQMFNDWELSEMSVPSTKEGHSTVTGQYCFKEGQFYGVKGEWVAIPVYDENEDATANNFHVTTAIFADRKVSKVSPTRNTPDCRHPNLMYIFSIIVNRLGYKIRKNNLKGTFAEHIYIAAYYTTGYWDIETLLGGHMSRALPHWTIEEFIKQFQMFFNVTVKFDDVNGSVDILMANTEENYVDITEFVIAEYNVDIIEDEDAGVNLADSNIAYKPSESDYHDMDMVDEEILANFRQVGMGTYDEVLADFRTSSDRMRTVWKCHQGIYIAKPAEGTQPAQLIRINHFGKLIRNKDVDDVELKITPCATDIQDIVTEKVYDYRHPDAPYAGQNKWETTVLCMKSTESSYLAESVYDAINDNDTDEVTEKEDVMQVFLVDDHTYTLTAESGMKTEYPEPFTDYRLHCVENHSIIHERWSLALSHSDAEDSIGKLHAISRQLNRNAEYQIRFFSDTMPSPDDIYVVRNKRYLCKKIEVEFTSRGMNKVVTGYFAEIL